MRVELNINKGFWDAVKIYISIVEEACDLFIDYINKEECANIINKYDLYEYINKNRKYETIIDERKYWFHGAGCTVCFRGKPLIEWDFGYRSWWCGIDPFKMAKTLMNSVFSETDYCDGNYIKKQCEKYLSDGILTYYKGQYYINLLKMGTKKMEFPVDYENMVIQYKGITKIYAKSKMIDRFIRKGSMAYEGITELKNNYMLIFYYKGDEVARVPYNDIAYPDAAVKIMNEQIIKPHQNEQWRK